MNLMLETKIILKTRRVLITVIASVSNLIEIRTHFIYYLKDKQICKVLF